MTSVRIKDPAGLLTEEEAGLQSGADTMLRVDASGGLWVRAITKSVTNEDGEIIQVITIADADGVATGTGLNPLFVESVLSQDLLQRILEETEIMNRYLAEMVGDVF